MAAEGGRRAYLVLGVKARQKAGGFHVDVEPMARDRVPKDATIHWFRWHKRERRR
jgi:hypothetical protein